MCRTNLLVLSLSLSLTLQGFPSSTSLGATTPRNVATVQQLDTNAAYRLTNDYVGPAKSLAVSKQGETYSVVMSITRNSPDQQWKLTALGSNKYRLTNISAGAGRSLDTPKPGNDYQVTMQASGSYTGQFWTLTPLGSGKVRLTNDYAGPSFSIDTQLVGTEHKVVMAGSGNYTGQIWTFTRIDLAPPQGTVVTGSGGAVNQPLVVSGLPTTPGASAKGQSLCVAGPGSICGDTKADWVGSHTLNTKCATGFYDAIWEGTCWQAPVDDSKGTWVRSATAVDKDDAFWRAPKETLSSATRVTTGTTFAWDCPSETFWDGYDRGGCWKCPDTHPRRTLNHVNNTSACATPMNETAPARFVKYNGCPTPDAKTMALPGKRTPGKPFYHAGSGCYSCPTTDEEGNILVTQRNIKPIAGDSYANNTGCAILFKWKPTPFVEPGMGGIAGIKDAIQDTFALTNQEILTFYFERLAKDKGYNERSPESIQYITQMWNEVAANPYKSPGLSTLMYGYLEEAIQTEAAQRTAAQAGLVQGFTNYVTARRTYIAQQALEMYDAWKAADQQNRQNVAQSSLQRMFYYGTVPLDFQMAASAGFALGASGVGTAAAVAGSVVHVRTTLQVANAARVAATAERAGQLAKGGFDAARAAKNIEMAVQAALRAQNAARALSALSNFRLLALGSQIALTVGPLAIAMAGSVLLSIAIDQAIEIAMAREKLTAAVDIAKQPADLNALLTAGDGRDLLAYYWAKAIDGTSPADPVIARLATTVAKAASDARYDLPRPAPETQASAVSTGLLAGVVQAHSATAGLAGNQPSTVAGLVGIWSLTAAGEIKRGNADGNWSPIAGQLKQISAGFDNSVFGVNSSGEIFQWIGTSWRKLPGGAVKVSVQTANRVVAVNAGGETLDVGRRELERVTDSAGAEGCLDWN